MEVFRRAILQADPPENFSLQTVQEVIKPQKQTKLAQAENQLVGNMLRTLLQELVSSAVQSGEPIMQFGHSVDDSETSQTQIPRLLDIVLYLCEKEHVDGGMVFQLLEDLTELSAMKNCKDIFGYIESKQDSLGKCKSSIFHLGRYLFLNLIQQELFAHGKLVMLRTCNQLLRRLSKLVGCACMISTVRNDWVVIQKFKPQLECFCNPALSLAPTEWQKFTSSLMVVLNTFDAQPLSDEEGDANVLEEEAATFNIKYLRSSKLMSLELKDPGFRSHVLVQCLILFDYLKAPGKNDKGSPSESMASVFFQKKGKNLIGKYQVGMSSIRQATLPTRAFLRRE